MGILYKIKRTAQKQDEPEEKDELKITKVSGYIETPVMKMCGTCEYLPSADRCNNKVVLSDPEMKKAEDGMLAIVDSVLGCCNQWEPK